MFRQRRATHGHLWTRVGTFTFGLLMVYYGTSLLSRGIFVFRNQYRMEVYSPAVAVTGGVFMLLALIPHGLVKWRIKPGEKTKPVAAKEFSPAHKRWDMHHSRASPVWATRSVAGVSPRACT